MTTIATVQPAESPHRCPYCHTQLQVEIGQADDGRVRFWLHCPGCEYAEEDRQWLGPLIADLRKVTRMSREYRDKLLANVPAQHPASRLMEWRLAQ